MSNEQLQLWKDLSKQARGLALDAINSCGGGHLGGVMSVMDAMVVLYNGFMRIDPAQPKNPDRDRFIMSKGHAGPALYTILAMKGFFPTEELLTLNANGTHLPSHCDMNKVPGVDMTAGSLGQGISAAAGMALCGKLDAKDYKVYCVVGDGECQEGEVWEAAMFCAQKKLDNMIVLVDVNGGQVDGYVKDIIAMDPMDEKWASFGFAVQVVDGHDHGAIAAALAQAQSQDGKPHAIILNTVKAKGLPGYQGTASCHHIKLNSEVYTTLKKGLE